MVIEDLYQRYHELQNQRFGQMVQIKLCNLRSPVASHVVNHWCDDARLPLEAFHRHDNPKLARDMCIAAMMIRIAETQGMDAAMLWKLANG